MDILDKLDLYINEICIDDKYIKKNPTETLEDYNSRMTLLDRLAKKRAKLMTTLIPRNNVILK